MEYTVDTEDMEDTEVTEVTEGGHDFSVPTATVDLSTVASMDMAGEWELFHFI